MIPLSALMKGLLWEALFCFIGHQIKLTAEFIRRMSAACQWFYISLLPEENSQLCEEGLIIYHRTCRDVCGRRLFCTEPVDLYTLSLL